MYNNSLIAKSVQGALFATVGIGLITAPAYGQQSQTSEETTADDQARAERIQVVGSRIRTDGIDNAAPIEIISAELATDMGLNTLGELLRTSTVASGSNQLISSQSVGNITAGGAGKNLSQCEA